VTPLDLPDAAARRRAVEGPDATVVVEGGAGTGRTTLLVERLATLVRDGHAPPGEIVMVTGSEASAADLRRRARAALDLLFDHDAVDHDAVDRDAVDHDAVDRDAVDHDAGHLDANHHHGDLTVCTAEGLAAVILGRHGAAAALPAALEVLDAGAEALDFDARWRAAADELLSDPEAEAVLVRAFALGIGPGDLAPVAHALQAEGDRSTRVAKPSGPRDPPAVVVDAGPVLEALERAVALAPTCVTEYDLLLAHVHGTVAPVLRELGAADQDEATLLGVLSTADGLACRLGARRHWAGAVDEVRSACRDAEEARRHLLDTVGAATLSELAVRLGTLARAAAAARRAEGRFTRHDLLVTARDLVRADPDVRRAVRHRYRWLLWDDASDAPPAAAELLALVGAGPEDDDGTAGGGALIVGCPGATLGPTDGARPDTAVAARRGAERVLLTASLRSDPAVVRFVNGFAAELTRSGVLGGDDWADLHPGRPATGAVVSSGPEPVVQLAFDGLATDASGGRRVGPVGPVPVVALGGPVAASAAEARRRAGRDVADAVLRVVNQGWAVTDGGHRRPARWRDIAVLVTAADALGPLEEALDGAGIPLHLEGADLLWDSAEVRDVLTLLAAVDDPDDPVAVLGALRTPALGCGDDDLVTWRRSHGAWDPAAPAPPGLEAHPVAVGLTIVDELHAQRWCTEPSELVRRAVEMGHGFELGYAQRHARHRWDRLRWLVDQARAFDEHHGGSLRAFLRWAQASAAAGEASSVGPPNEDDDAVRVMTIDGARGLEFPVVVVAGLDCEDTVTSPPPAVLWGEAGEVELRRRHVRTAGYDEALRRRRQRDRRQRLHDVAMATTRARDHLLLALHHRDRATVDSCPAAVLHELCGRRTDLWRRLPIEDPALVAEG
jgi:superfamily I DNA/RNA helicase